jgi:hypothetical protein
MLVAAMNPWGFEHLFQVLLRRGYKKRSRPTPVILKLESLASFR